MSIDTYDCERFTVDRTSQHRARKEHKCCACHGTIHRGELYTYSFTIHDGHAESLRRCARCDAIYEHLCSRHTSGEAWPEWSLHCGHGYDEVFGEEPPPEIAALAFMTAEEVLAQRGPIKPTGGKVIT